MTWPIIALTGRAGAGKSTAAAALIDQEAALIKFAGPLKAMARALYHEAGAMPWDIPARIEGRLKEKPDPVTGGISPRRIMQTLGTEWGRDTLGADFWVTLFRSAAVRHLKAGRLVVVDDCRFENEAAAIRDMGGVIIEITRPGLRPLGGGHKSEAGVAADLHLANIGTPDDLAANLAALIAADG